MRRLSNFSYSATASCCALVDKCVAELLAVARVEPDYRGLDETARRDVLLRLLGEARPLRVRDAAYSPLALGELAIFESAVALRASFTMLATRFPERMAVVWMLEAPTIFWGLWKARGAGRVCGQGAGARRAGGGMALPEPGLIP